MWPGRLWLRFLQRTGAECVKGPGSKSHRCKILCQIFYRNAINIGLPVVVEPDLYDKVNQMDEIELDLTEGFIKTEDETLPCTKLPPYMQNILDHGGLINFFE